MIKDIKKPLLGALVLTLILGYGGVVLAGNTQYSIQAQLNDTNRIIRGQEQIEFTNDLSEPTSEVVLILRANLYREPNPYLSKINLDSTYPSGFNPGWTKVRAITGPNGNKLNYELESLPPTSQTYSLENTILRVKLNNPVGPGEKRSIAVDFSTKIPRKKEGDMEYFQGVYTWRFGWYPVLAPSGWWRGYDRKVYSQRKLKTADYEVQLTVPETFVVGGNKVNETEVKSDAKKGDKKRKLLEFELKEARSFPFVASARYEKYHEEFKEFTVEVLHRPGYEERARVLASYANEILTFYSKRFGEYEREKLIFAQGAVSGYFGMAADGIIVLGDSFFGESQLALSNITNRLSEYLIAHEIAHQWFGIGVGADLHTQNWISEAFSEYLSLNYFHHKYPEYKPNLFRFEENGLIRSFIESQLGYINLRNHMFELPYIVNFQKGFDEAIVKPRQDVKYANATQTRIYKKGYMVLRTLEGIIGEGSMDEFIREIYENYDEDIVDVDLLAEKVKEISGKEIPEGFFHDWLKTPGYIDYGVSGLTREKLDSGNYSNEISVTKSGSLPAPVELQVLLENDEKITRTVVLKGDKKTIKLETPERVKRVTVDPNNYVMDKNRLNNHFPRKVEISLGENRLPLDAHFLMVGAGTITGRTPNRILWSIGPGFAQGRLKLDRNLSLSGGAVIKGKNLSSVNVNGWLGASLDLWTNPETGSASQYWLQNRSLDLRLDRVTGKEGRTYNLLSSQLNLSRSVSENWSLDIGSTVSFRGESRLSLGAKESQRILPGAYLNYTASVGLSPGKLPQLMKFKLSELKSYGEWKTDTYGSVGWQKRTFPGNYKFYSKISLGFPISSNERYYLGNLALIKDVRQNLYLSAGDTWDSLDELGPGDFKYEGGIEISLGGKTLGGLFPFDLTVGYAYHGQDKGRPYFNFSLGL